VGTIYLTCEDTIIHSMHPTILLPLFCLLIACTKGRDSGREGDCPPDMNCTMEFRTITVTLKDSGNRPVALDSYRTVRLSDNYVFELQGSMNPWEDSFQRATGAYPLITDSEQKKLSTKGTLLEFRGDKDGTTVVREQYNVKDNCCHVELVSGQTELVIAVD
jgi:hypothetical protein